MGGFGDFGIDRVITLARGRSDDLDVDTHPVEIGQAAVDRRHYLANMVFLLCVDFLACSIGKIRQRNATHIDMRLRVRRGLGDDDMGVNIDRWRRWSSRAAVRVMDARGGAAVAVLAVDHRRGPVVELVNWDMLVTYCLGGRCGQRVETAVASASPRPAASASSKHASAPAATGSCAWTESAN